VDLLLSQNIRLSYRPVCLPLLYSPPYSNCLISVPNAITLADTNFERQPIYRCTRAGSLGRIDFSRCCFSIRYPSSEAYFRYVPSFIPDNSAWPGPISALNFPHTSRPTCCSPSIPLLSTGQSVSCGVYLCLLHRLEQ
jgi:hypothetical protein